MNLKVINTILDKIEDFAAVFCFGAMCVDILVAVFLRYVVAYPFPWGEEMARYLMIWGVFFGISIGTRKKAHLGVENFVEMLPPKVKAPVAALSPIIMVFAYALLAVLSLILVLTIKANGQKTPSLRIPTFIVYSALPVGFFLSLIRSIQVLWVDVIRKLVGGESSFNEVKI